MKCTNGTCRNEAKRGHKLCPNCIKEADKMDQQHAAEQLKQLETKPRNLRDVWQIGGTR